MVLALGSILMGLFRHQTVPGEADWATVDGFVLSADVESHLVDGSSAGRADSIFYDAVVRYQFMAEGKPVQGRSVIGEVSKNDPTRIRMTVAAYPEGKIVRIRYNPEAPEQSAIVVPPSERSLAFYVAALVFLAGALLCRILVPKKTPAPAAVRKKRPVVSEPADAVPAPTPALPPADPGTVSELAGQWILEYQTPSMAEIISSAHNVKDALSSDVKAVLASSSQTLTVTFTDREVTFSFRDARNTGRCDIVSDYRISGNLLSLAHKSMDFLMTDIEDFPPRSYTWTRRESRLSLVSHEIQGLGGRRITYHLARPRQPV
ncbi:hypothetical protein JCM14469_37580 [Desulfatiferula olefinivorans]